jgi:hypothetical protein
MVSPALALLWQTWGRYRLALAALVAGFVALIAFQHTLIPSILVSETGVFLTVLPLGLFFACAGFIFSHGEIGPRPKNSSFPAWMFTLPVSTGQLVLWPMLGGAAAMALMWVVTARVVFRPVGLDVPVWWPALGLAATLAWLQAIDWSPLGLLNKFLLAVVTLVAVWGTSYAVVEKYHVEDWRALPLLLFLPAAYAAALAGVSRARHGAFEGRAGWQGLLETVARHLPERRRPFASPGRAQFWLEWRRCGVLVPVVLGAWATLLAALGLLVSQGFLGEACLLTLVYLVPIFSPLAGAVLGKSEVWSRQFAMSAYTAGRPLTSGSLATARILAAVWGLWVGCALLAGIAALSFALRDNWEMAQSMWRNITRGVDPRYEQVVGPLFVLGLGGATSLQLTGHLCAGLSGRFWVLAATFGFYLLVVPNFILIDSLVRNTGGGGDYKVAVADLFPVIVYGLILLKFQAATGVAYALLRRRLATVTFVATVFAFWLVSAGSLLGYVVCRTGMDPLRPLPVGVILYCPLTRVLLAPLAVEWNRRR